MTTTFVFAILLAITTHEVRSDFGFNLLPSGSISLKKGGEVGLQIETPGLIGKKRRLEIGIGGNFRGSVGIKNGDTENENRAVLGQEQNHVEHSSGGGINVNNYENNNENERRYTGAGVNYQTQGKLAATSDGHNVFSATANKLLSFGGSVWTRGKSAIGHGPSKSSVTTTSEGTPENDDGIANQHINSYEVHYGGQENIGNRLEHDMTAINGKRPTSSGSYGAGVTVHKEGSLGGALGGHGFSIEGKKQVFVGGGAWSHGASGIEDGQTQGSVEATIGHTSENDHDIGHKHTNIYEVHYSGQENIGSQSEHDLGTIGGNRPTSSGSYGAGVSANIGGGLAGTWGANGFGIEGKKQISVGGGAWSHGASGIEDGQTQGSAEATIGHTSENDHDIGHKHTNIYKVHYSGQGNIGSQSEHDLGTIDGNRPTSSGSYGAGVTVHKEGSLGGALGGHGFSIEGKKQVFVGGGAWSHGASGIGDGQTQGSAEATIGHTSENDHDIGHKHTNIYEVHYSGQGNIGSQPEHDLGTIDGNRPTSSGSYGAGVSANIGGGLAGTWSGNGFSIEGKKQVFVGGGAWSHGASGIENGQTQGSTEATIEDTSENDRDIGHKHTNIYEVHYSGQGNIGSQPEHDLGTIDGKRPTSSGSYGAGVTVHKEGSLGGALGGHGFSIEGKKQVFVGGGAWSHGASGIGDGQTQGSAEATIGHTSENDHDIGHKHTNIYEVHYSGQGNIGSQPEHDLGTIDGNRPTSSGSYGAGVSANIGGGLAGTWGGNGFSIEGKKQVFVGGGAWSHGASGIENGQTQGSTEATIEDTSENDRDIGHKHTNIYEVHYSGQGNIGSQPEHDLGTIDGKRPTSSGSYGAGVTVHKEGSLGGALGGHGFSIEGKKQVFVGGGAWSHGASGIENGQTQGSTEATIEDTSENDRDIGHKHTNIYEVHYSGQGNIGSQPEHDLGTIDGKRPTSSGSYGAGVTVHKEGSLGGALGGQGFSIEGKKQVFVGGGAWSHGASGIEDGQTQGSAEATIGHTSENDHDIGHKHTNIYEVHYSGQGNIGSQSEHDLGTIDGNRPTSSGSYGAGVTVHKEGSLGGALGGHGFSIEGKKQVFVGGGAWSHGASGIEDGQTQGSAEATIGHTSENDHDIGHKHTNIYKVHYSGQGNIGSQSEHDLGTIDGNRPTSSGSYGAGVSASIGGGLAGTWSGNGFSIEGKKQVFVGGGAWSHGASGIENGQTQGSVKATSEYTPENDDDIANKHTKTYEVQNSGQGDIGNQLEHDMSVNNGKKPTSSGSYGAGVTVHKKGSLGGALGGLGSYNIEGQKHFAVGIGSSPHGSPGNRVGETQGSSEVLVKQNLEHDQEPIVNADKNKYEPGYTRFGNSPTQTEHNMDSTITNDMASSGSSGAGTSLDNDNKVVWGIDHGININDRKQVSSTTDQNDQISGAEEQHSGFGQIQKHEHGRIEVGTGGDIERPSEAKIYRNENGHTGCVNGHHHGQSQDHSRYYANIGNGIGIQTTENGYRQTRNQGTINSEQEHGYVKHITFSSGDQNENQRLRQSQDAAHHGASFEIHSEKQGGIRSHQGEHNHGYSVVYVKHTGQDGSGAGVWSEGDVATVSNAEIDGEHIGHLETQKHGEFDPGFILSNYLNKPGVLVYKQSTDTDDLISGQRVFNGRPSLSGKDNKQSSLNWEIDPSKFINHGQNGELRHFSEHRYGYHRGNSIEHQSKSEVRHFSTSATSSGHGGFSVESSASHTTSNDDGGALHAQSNPIGNSLHRQSSVEISGDGLLDIRMNA